MSRMIIFISISNRQKPFLRLASPLLMGVVAAAAAPPVVSKTADTGVRAVLQAGFEKAIFGKARATPPAAKPLAVTSFGMTCTARASAARPMLTITLPQPLAARRHVFAVISPSGRLHELYSPYSDDVEIADIIIPSEEISWQKVQRSTRFTFAAPQLFATEPGQRRPAKVFREKGRYQFALVSAIQKDLIAVSDKPGQVTVHAGCLIDWAP